MKRTVYLLAVLFVSVTGSALAKDPKPIGISIEPAPQSFAPAAVPQNKSRFDPVIRNMEGWNVYIEPRLLTDEGNRENARALAMLANHLQRIAVFMPKASLAKMRKLEIWIEYIEFS